ncbi:Retrovirus-related Pol polyprotein from transposon TNT 1-94 [Eumeta japonica]|uniref:Retrovirus-related Pol polyprotein from transposon TNT 1-94 n=1 Tax=Eumeta variegata TaxID=151549 RepID=A0A4C1TKT8_EUMVA|nr:Retrovirus-related Pol polyprotein from transposon TNT 1-94 [Eumeta japonica]
MSLDPTQQTLNNLTARLLDEESSLASVEEQETALLVVNKGWKNVPKQNGPRSCGSGTSQNKTTKHRFECYNCGKRGHFSKECRFPKQNKPRKHLKESSDMLAFNVEISSYNTEENAWIMDSGASAHMTFRKDFFVELLKCSEKSLTLGNKQSVEVSGIGKVLIKRYVNGQWETSELHGVLILHTDNGREYVNKVFKEYLDKEGIVHELTAPLQNKMGVQREIRTIVESARSMLYARDLPLDLWAEAVNCAVYILNRTSSSQTPGKTPYELWNGTKPELGHLKVFGSIGYVHVPDQLRTKLEKKSEKMLLIGYDNTNYRMYDMNKKTIKISRNVIFDEHQVPEVRKNITQICTIDDNEETTIQNNETEVRNMDETLIKTTVSESDDSLLSCNNDDPTYEPSQEIEDIMSHRNITLRPRNNRRFEANLVELSLPQTYDEALQSPQKYEWSQAIKEELSAHKENNTWNAVPRAGQRTLTTKWVFTIKKGENNEARYKARLCAPKTKTIALSTTEAEFVASCETAKEILWLQQLLLELVLDMHLEQCSSTQNSVFSGLSRDIQNDLIKSIAQVIRDEIKSKVNFAKFVSVIADETPDISHREQMPVIFRYLTKTGIEERFVDFFYVTLERGADQLSQSILEFIDQFNCKEKLVGQSYDGAAVMSGAQGGVQTKIKLQCPMAVFIPCYAHVLNLVLSRSLENIPELKQFFGHINYIIIFYKSTKRSGLLKLTSDRRFLVSQKLDGSIILVLLMSFVTVDPT